MPVGATREQFLAYQTLLHQKHKRLMVREEQLDARKAVADASSARRAAQSSTNSQNHAISEPHAVPKTQPRVTANQDLGGTKQTLNMDTSQLTRDSSGNLVAKTPEAAILAARVYLQTIEPPEGDPRAKLHNSTIAGLTLLSLIHI